MTPSILFFLIFLLTSLLFGIYSFIILYHLIRFGIGTRPKQISFIFFLGSLVLFIMMSIGFFSIDTETIIKENSKAL